MCYFWQNQSHDEITIYESISTMLVVQWLQRFTCQMCAAHSEFLFCLFSLFCHHCGCAELASSVPTQTVFDTQQLGLKNHWFDGKCADLKSTSAGIPKQRPNWIAGHCKPVFVLIVINQKLSLRYTLYYKMNEFNPFRNKSLIISSVTLESTHREVSTIPLF